MFEGLWIAEHSDWEWQEHPVVVIDFSNISSETPENLKLDLGRQLNRQAAEQQVTLTAPLLTSQFTELILALHRKSGQPVVVMYIFEFKCNQSAETAIQQIRDKQYADRYRSSGASIFLIGVNFSTETHNVADWMVHKET